jgi:two-component system, NtrC family, sensor kinase
MNTYTLPIVPPSLPRQAWREWGRTALPIGVALVLFTLGLANIVLRATSVEVEDGVLWVERSGVVAAEVAAGTPAARAGLQQGDVLLAIDGRPVEFRSDVLTHLRGAGAGARTDYTVLRLGSREVLELSLAPIPRGAGALYYVLAAVGIFTLLVGATVRIRRPDDQATLHFFWLAVAFFGVFTFSFSGRLDRVDWVFYWGDQVALLLLPPLFLHFALVFPERPHSDGFRSRMDRWLPAVYLPAAVLLSTRALAMIRAGADPEYFIRLIAFLDRLELVYLAAFLVGGLVVLVRALGKVRSVTSRRQLRWIVWGTALGGLPFALGYALPWALGGTPSLPMQLSAIPLGFIPLAFASAIVRYRLMDVEVILKRLFVYTVGATAAVAVYALLLRSSNTYFVQSEDEHRWLIAFLATVVMLLLARPVKDALQATIDRAFYRDRYDYRRALVAFARDLNGDLDLTRLADRLVSRVKETLVVDRMALMLATEGGAFESLRDDGFGHVVPPLRKGSALAGRLELGHTVRLDEPLAVSRFDAEEVEFWRDAGIYYFVPCVSKDSAIAVLALGRRESGEPLNSEDMGLLAAVAGQVATAIENGRLYHQLHLKAVELDRLRSFSQNILESLDDGLLVVGRDDRVMHWNQALERIYGVAAPEALGQPLSAIFDPAFRATVDAARRDHPQGATLSRVPLTGRGAHEGTRLLVNVTTVPLQPMADSAEPGGTVVMLQDVTGRVALEEQLRISEKMASLGLLAAGVAHEVNTPLTGISSYTQMLLEQADPSDPRTGLLEKIEKQTFRAARIVNGLLNLARPSSQADQSERIPVDLNAVIGDVLSLLEHQLAKSSIKLRRELGATPVTLVGYEFKLQQVCLNLFLNARDAMPSGGWLTVATRMEGNEVVAEISDTGGGIAREHLDRIYDPFFTTKAPGYGTGLGLSITYGIVQEHHGSIHCDSGPGQGTRFTLRFPAAAAHFSSARQREAGR